MITSKNMYGYTPMYLAAQYQAYTDMVQILLDSGPDDIVTYQDNDGYTPFI